MKNLEIVGIVNAYMARHKDGEGIKLPAAVAWKRRLNIDKLFHAKGIIDEAMKEIFQKYSDEEHSEERELEDGKKDRVIKPEYVADFRREQAEIMEQDTEVEIRKVSISELGNIELSDADMDTIAFMLED